MQSVPDAAPVRSFRRHRWAGIAVIVGLLAACASGPSRVDDPQRDGPPARPPAGLAGIADADPRVEPIRVGGPNKPYEIFGRSYVPTTRDLAYPERGLASWYGRKFHGRPTASGEPYDMYAMTAAHPTLPIPSYARIRNPANGREVVVRINDRGPFHRGRIVDLSYAAALRLDLLRGVAPVELERLTFDDIRVGTWRRGGALPPAIPMPTETPTEVAQGSSSRTTVAAPLEPIAATAAEIDAPGAALRSTARGEGESAAGAAAALSADPQAPGFWVQLGAFRERDGADAFQRRVAADQRWLTPLLATVGDADLYRVQAGPYASRADAQEALQRLREALLLVPLIVERR